MKICCFIYVWCVLYVNGALVKYFLYFPWIIMVFLWPYLKSIVKDVSRADRASSQTVYFTLKNFNINTAETRNLGQEANFISYYNKYPEAANDQTNATLEKLESEFSGMGLDVNEIQAEVDASKQVFGVAIDDFFIENLSTGEITESIFA